MFLSIVEPSIQMTLTYDEGMALAFIRQGRPLPDNDTVLRALRSRALITAQSPIPCKSPYNDLVCTQLGAAALRRWILDAKHWHAYPADPFGATLANLDLLSFAEQMHWIETTQAVFSLQLADVRQRPGQHALIFESLASDYVADQLNFRIEWLGNIKFDFVKKHAQ